ncbi:MAG: hypothetical protein JSS99_10210 [Actinobacteria bacterium]|nr:hypothetical protein [Actinomycetota bacterium]
MVAVAAEYPAWKFYPSRSEPPAWVTDVVEVFAAVGAEIDSRTNHGVTSDAALALLRPGLVSLGFEIESGKTKAGRIKRPVLFGEMGRPRLAYEIDGFHPGHGIVLEVEAGRGAANNADYRDLIRTSLIVDAEYLVLAMMLQYRPGTAVMRSYERTREQIDAIYESERLRLPFRGVLLVGY